MARVAPAEEDPFGGDAEDSARRPEEQPDPSHARLSPGGPRAPSPRAPLSRGSPARPPPRVEGRRRQPRGSRSAQPWADPAPPPTARPRRSRLGRGAECRATRPAVGAARLRRSPDRHRRLRRDRKSTRLNSSHVRISYAVFCLKKKKKSHSILPLKKKKTQKKKQL